jgi:diadenosine tetraphosphate (Ap4A) HIT family hydrolase
VPRDCYVCTKNAEIGSLPVREAILVDGGWRLAHAFDSSLPGWLVLMPTRHVYALDELTVEESQVMGELLVRGSAALRTVVGCEKTYTMLFAEAAGFAHLHVHLVPRMSSFTADQVGPQVFSFLGRSPGERLSEDEQDRISQRLRQALFENR